MSPIERIHAVLARRTPDRLPIGFWHHFRPDQVSGPAAVEAHLHHLEKFQLDFLKVMNDNPYPHHTPVGSIDDLGAIQQLTGDEPEFARQLELIAALRPRVQGRVLMTTTIFNAWATLRQLIQPPKELLPPNLDEAIDPPSEWILSALKQRPQAVTQALATIAENLARFARRCLEAGADGVFLSVRDDWVEQPHHTGSGLYRKLVRPLDQMILESAAGGQFNILHVCGRSGDLRMHRDYPVQVLNWADRAAGPAIADVKDWLTPAICAGVDQDRTLVHGSPDDVVREVKDSIRQAAGRPIIISPGCTFDPARVPEANLLAIARAVQQSKDE